MATVLTVIGAVLVGLLLLAYIQEQQAIRRRRRRLQEIDWQAQQAKRRIQAQYDAAARDIIWHSLRHSSARRDGRRPRGRS